MRICKNCNIEKELSEYYLKTNGKIKSSYCKSCYGILYKGRYNKKYYEENKEKFRDNYKNWSEKNDRTHYMEKYREENKEDLLLKMKDYREKNKDYIRDKKKQYYNKLSLDRKEKIKERARELYKLNECYKKRKRQYLKNRIENDPIFKLTMNIRSLIKNAFSRKFKLKSKKTIEILGCSFEEFKTYLESKFDDRMNWENQGTYWHMDHIIPISSAKTEEDVYRLNHYTNFQPLYWEDNLRKSNKIG